MRIFKNAWFSHFAEKEGITDAELRGLVDLLETGQAIDLGGGVYKIRFARPGEGKRGGYRVIVFYRTEELTFYEYCFAKSNRSTINPKLLKYYKDTAKEYLSMTPAQLRERKEQGKLIEL